MPDRSTSALWFVKNVLHEKFLSQAKAKKFSIARLNQAITTAGVSSGCTSKKCGHCDRNFDARSFPSNCTRCANRFHKTNCYKAHRCKSMHDPPIVSSLSLSTPNSSSALVSTSSSTLPILQSQQLSNSSSNSHVLPISTIVVPSSTTITSCLSSSSVTASSSSQEATVPSSSTNSLNTLITFVHSSSISSSVISSSALNVGASSFSPPPRQTKKARCSQNVSTFTPERAEVESLKIELSYARTKITDLRMKNKDQEETINIYSQKLKLLENNRHESMKEKYFNQRDTDSSPPSSSLSSSMSSSLDCKCRIRAQIAKNALNIHEINQKLQHQATPSSAGLSSPSISPSSVPSLSSPSLLLDSSHNPVADNLPGVNNTTSDVSQPLAEMDVRLNSDHESDFDFSESFEAPIGSPTINLN